MFLGCNLGHACSRCRKLLSILENEEKCNMSASSASWIENMLKRVGSFLFAWVGRPHLCYKTFLVLVFWPEREIPCRPCKITHKRPNDHRANGQKFAPKKTSKSSRTVIIPTISVVYSLARSRTQLASQPARPDQTGTKHQK